MSWSTSELRVRLAPWNRYKTLQLNIYWRSKAVLLLWIICIIYVFCFSCFRLFIAALWSPAGKGLAAWLLFVMFNCVVVIVSMWYPGSGVVLDCLDSWPLPPFLLCVNFCLLILVLAKLIESNLPGDHSDTVHAHIHPACSKRTFFFRDHDCNDQIHVPSHRNILKWGEMRFCKLNGNAIWIHRIAKQESVPCLCYSYSNVPCISIYHFFLFRVYFTCLEPYSCMAELHFLHC